MTMNTMTTASRFRTTIAATLVGAAASGFAFLPAVADSFDAPQATVKFGDLHISSPEGAAVLYGRIKSAAKSVCSQFDGPGVHAYQQRNACINKAMRDSVTKVNAPTLFAIFSAKTGKEVPTRLVSR
jgi:UrcA family protein